jgi:hypothetical protein
MLSRLKESWRAFRDADPGHRFTDSYERRQQSGRGKVGTVVSIALGSVLIVGGLVGLVAPGPGLLGLAFGAALIAREFAWAARALDALELKLRAWAGAALHWWRRASLGRRGAVVLAAAAVAALAAFGVWRVLFGR